jgi:beta-lactamase class A
VLGDALPADKRAILTTWLETNTTGAQDVRAGVPRSWTVADKTGRANDVAIAWPPNRAPLVIAVMSDRAGYDTPVQVAIIAEAAEFVSTAL